MKKKRFANLLTNPVLPTVICGLLIILSSSVIIKPIFPTNYPLYIPFLLTLNYFTVISLGITLYRLNISIRGNISFIIAFVCNLVFVLFSLPVGLSALLMHVLSPLLMALSLMLSKVTDYTKGKSICFKIVFFPLFFFAFISPVVTLELLNLFFASIKDYFTKQANDFCQWLTRYE